MFYKTVIHINLTILNLIFINMYLSILLFSSVVLFTLIEVTNLNDIILPANAIFTLSCVIISLIAYGLRGRVRKTQMPYLCVFISMSVAFVFKLSGIFAINIFGLHLLAPLFAALSVTIGYAVGLGLEGKQSNCLSYLRVFVSTFVVYTFIIFIKYIMYSQVDLNSSLYLISIYTGWSYILSEGIYESYINSVLYSSTGSGGVQGNTPNVTQAPTSSGPQENTAQVNSSNAVQNNPTRSDSEASSISSVDSNGSIHPNDGYGLDRTMRIVNALGNDSQAIDRYFSIKRDSIINSYRIDSNNAAASGATTSELEGWLDRKNELLSLLADQKDDVKDLVE